MRTVFVIGLASALLVGPLAGQTGGQGMGGMHQGMGGMHQGMGGMHQGMGGMHQGQGMGMGMMVPGPVRKYLPFAPEQLLEMKGMLELTGDQEAKLTALQEAAQKASENAHAPAHAAMESLQKELASATPNLEAVKGYFMAHNAAMGNTQWIALSTALQARVLLTEGQRKHIEEMGGHMGGMGNMNHGGPPNKP